MSSSVISDYAAMSLRVRLSLYNVSQPLPCQTLQASLYVFMEWFDTRAEQALKDGLAAASNRSEGCLRPCISGTTWTPTQTWCVGLDGDQVTRRVDLGQDVVFLWAVHLRQSCRMSRLFWRWCQAD